MNESDRTVSPVHFGPPSDRAWLPDKTRILIESALDAARVKISNGTVPHDRAVWETLQLWADALFGIYRVTIGLPADGWSNAPANDPRYALMEPETITENVSRRVRELVAEYAKYNLPIEQCDLDRLTDMVRHRTRVWLRRTEAEVFGVAIPEMELLTPPIPPVASAEATVTTAKKKTKVGWNSARWEKHQQRERLKEYVKGLRDANNSHRDICKRLDDRLDLYPSPWKGETWTTAFNRTRNKVDKYITNLK